MRFRLRTLLILLAVAPPLLAVGWARWAEFRVEQERRELARKIDEEIIRRLNAAAAFPTAQTQP